jgi:hypothetical protein
MNGFSHENYISQVNIFRRTWRDEKHLDEGMLKLFFMWLRSRNLVNVDQGKAVFLAFKEAMSCDDTELEKMDILVTGTWKSSHGSGTFTTSSARREEIWLKTDHTYSFHGVRTTSVTLPPVGGSPYPQAYATSGSTSNEQGIYIVCSPSKILLLSNYGGVRFARYYKNDYVLMVDGGGVYGK